LRNHDQGGSCTSPGIENMNEWHWRTYRRSTGGIVVLAAAQGASGP
jgi:hypothetical protein